MESPYVNMNLEVLTPEKTIYAGKVKLISVPGTKAPFTVLRNHAPIISTLEKGFIRIVTEMGNDLHYLIDKGIIEVNNNNIKVLVEKISEEDGYSKSDSLF